MMFRNYILVEVSPLAYDPYAVTRTQLSPAAGKIAITRTCADQLERPIVTYWCESLGQPLSCVVPRDFIRPAPPPPGPSLPDKEWAAKGRAFHIKPPKIEVAKGRPYTDEERRQFEEEDVNQILKEAASQAGELEDDEILCDDPFATVDIIRMEPKLNKGQQISGFLERFVCKDGVLFLNKLKVRFGGGVYSARTYKIVDGAKMMISSRIITISGDPKPYGRQPSPSGDSDGDKPSTGEACGEIVAVPVVGRWYVQHGGLLFQVIDFVVDCSKSEERFADVLYRSGRTVRKFFNNWDYKLWKPKKGETVFVNGGTIAMTPRQDIRHHRFEARDVIVMEQNDQYLECLMVKLGRTVRAVNLKDISPANQPETPIDGRWYKDQAGVVILAVSSGKSNATGQWHTVVMPLRGERYSIRHNKWSETGISLWEPEIGDEVDVRINALWINAKGDPITGISHFQMGKRVEILSVRGSLYGISRPVSGCDHLVGIEDIAPRRKTGRRNFMDLKYNE